MVQELLGEEIFAAADVAQIFNLPYRRFATCVASLFSSAWELSGACRLQVGDTAD